MSKAFLRESDAPETPEPRAPISVLPPGTTNYLTAAGAERLRAELKTLRTTERPALAARVAAQDADARPRLAVIDQRIRHLQQSLFSAQVVTSPRGPTDVVRFGATVTVRDASGAETEYRLVGVDEADPASGAVSWISPVARALMNARVGDTIRLNTPAGPHELEITGIRFDP